MMSKNVPDPRDVRKYDLIGVFGMVNYRTLRVSAQSLYAVSTVRWWQLGLLQRCCCAGLCCGKEGASPYAW